MAKRGRKKKIKVDLKKNQKQVQEILELLAFCKGRMLHDSQVRVNLYKSVNSAYEIVQAAKEKAE